MPDTSLLAHFYLKLGGTDAPEDLMQDLGNVEVNDSDIITKIAREYGLKPAVDDTTEVYAYILENNQTDFEFIMERARRIGFSFLVDDQSLLFKKPGSLPSETVALEYGVSLR